MTSRKRRQFIQGMGISSALVALGDWGSKSLAQEVFSISESTIEESEGFNPEFSAEKTVQLILNELETAQPNSILSVDNVEAAQKTPELFQAANSLLSRELENQSPEQVDALIESLNQVFYFNQKTGELTTNPKIYLNSGQEKVVEELINGFKKELETNQITLEKQADNLFIPITEKPELTFIEPLSFSSPFQSVPNQYQLPGGTIVTANLKCRWLWSKRIYYWGWRITLNRCLLHLIRLLLARGATVSTIALLFGFPFVVANIIVALIAILVQFSNVHGVRIYITWFGVIIWITGA